MTKTVCGGREFYRHEGKLLRLKKFDFAFVEAALVSIRVVNVGADDARQKVIEDDVLIVEADEFLKFWERSGGMFRCHAIMEAKEEAL